MKEGGMRNVEEGIIKKKEKNKKSINIKKEKFN